jgi:hypothetical protein
MQMNTVSKIFFVFGILIISVVGCASVAPARSTTIPNLTPTLDKGITLKIYVEDRRPAVETEKQPSTEFLYSGTLFKIDHNAETIAGDLGNIAIKYEGTKSFSVVNSIPPRGVGIVFKLDHWYSRAPLKSTQAPAVVTGAFKGVLSMVRNGEVVLSKPIERETATYIDAFVFKAKEKLEEPRVLWEAMMRTANTAQQNGYMAMYEVLRENWHLLNN